MTNKLRLQSAGVLPTILTVAVAAVASYLAATWSVNRIEEGTYAEVSNALSVTGHDWTDVSVDGLQVILSGTAKDEATRFAALSEAGTIIDASRLTDNMGVAEAAKIAAPPFSIEVLRNGSGVTLIGLVPSVTDRAELIEQVQDIADDAQVTDLLESADFTPPDGWDRALAFGIDALGDLPRSKISISPSAIAVTAMADTERAKRELEKDLTANAPRNVVLELAISAPRPVITPFTLRFLIDADGPRFDACSADTDQARNVILAAAAEAGLQGSTVCTIGLGTPTTRWGEGTAAGIRALAEIGIGTITYSDADITLVAAAETPSATFDRAVGELDAALPPAFSLHAIRLEPPEDDGGSNPNEIAEFIATRSPEGLVQLRGRIGDELSRSAIESYAAARFGTANIYPATRIDPDLPGGWPLRVLTSLEALSLLNNGVAVVQPGLVDITGYTGRKNARAEISRLLSSKLEDGQTFNIDVTYSEALDPLAALPTPEECVEKINAAAAKRKITFEPSSTDIERDALETVDAIAELLRDCQTVEIEISGHTDSQGREIMNQQLSQARADAVLNEIMSRRVLTSNLTAKGYGEAEPIADNATEAGREANRRIEFRLILPEPEPEPEMPEDTAETSEEKADE